MTITLVWWEIPTIITALALLWVVFWPANDGGYMGLLARFFMLVPALAVVSVVWIIAAIMK